MAELAVLTYHLPLSGMVVQSRGGVVGSRWRLIDAGVLDDPPMLAATAWQTPSGRLVTGGRFYARPPDPRAGKWWVLRGDRTEEPVSVTVHEPAGDRRVYVINVGGAWVAEWSGPPSKCLITRGAQQAEMWFDRPVGHDSGGPGWYRPIRRGPS